jgi:hypothetical protein
LHENAREHAPIEWAETELDLGNVLHSASGRAAQRG